MKYRKILIFSCLIICLFGIASVCASDVNETMVSSDEINQELGIDAESASLNDIRTDDVINESSEENYVLSLNDNEKLTGGNGTNLDATNFTTVYNKDDYLIVTLKDRQNKEISGVNLTVNLNGLNYYITDDNGQIRIPTKGLNASTYNVNINFPGDEKYNKSSTTIKLIVEKLDLNLTLKDNYVLNYDSFTDIILGNNGISRIIAKIDGRNVNVSDNKIRISGLDLGNHTLTVTAIPDSNHNAVTKNATITVNKINSSVIISDVNLNYGSSVNLSITVDGVVDLVAKIDGNEIEVTDNKIIIPKLNVGNHTLSVTSIPDANHNAVTKTATITVNKVNSSITVNNISLNYGRSFKMVVNSEGVVGLVANIDGRDIDVTGNTIAIPKLDVGNHTLSVTSIPDANHNPVTKNSTISVNKDESQIVTFNFDATVGQGVNLTVRVIGTSSSVDEGIITFFDGETKIGQCSVDKSIARLNYIPSKVGVYSILAVYNGTSRYSPSNSTFKLNVLEKSNATNKTEFGDGQVIVIPYVEGFSGDVYAEIILPGDATGTVTLTVNNTDYAMELSNGTAKVKLHDVGDDVCPYTLTYSGNAKYFFFVDKGTFKVNRTKPVENSTGPDEGKKINFPSLDGISAGGSASIKLPVDATGTVTLTVNNTDYVFNVSNGVCNVKLPDLANGDYPYTLTYSGDAKYSSFTDNGTFKASNYQNISVDKSRIDASNVKVTYGDGSHYSITVYGANGKVANGVKVAVKINGKAYDNLITDANGIAKFKVTQAPGLYKVLATALGKSVQKTLTVKHLLTLKSVAVKKSAKKIILRATLGKINGKYLKNKKITFKFNGKKYTAKTNSKGVAKVTIKSTVLKKLKVGKKVSYQATYLSDIVKKSVKVKK